MKRYTFILAGTLFTLLSARAGADYTVQIGAMGETHAGFADRAATIGPVSTRPGSSGLTVYQVGRYAVRTRLVEVFFNMGGGPLRQDDYRGVYVLMEKIKRGSDRVDIGCGASQQYAGHRARGRRTSRSATGIESRDLGLAK